MPGFGEWAGPAIRLSGAWPLHRRPSGAVNLNDISPTDKPQRPDAGSYDHIAFGSADFYAIKHHLTRQGVSFLVNEVPEQLATDRFFLPTPTTGLATSNFDVRRDTPSR